MKTTSEMITLAGTGANLIIDAKSKTASELITIIGVVGRKNGHITIKNLSSKTVTELLSICRNYPDCITLDLTN
jgi:CheY-specific phosphatase CheX